MFKADVAEWILSMTTTSERATATAGDLMQESSARGNLWFWSSLLRTTASLVWRAWTAEPFYLTGLALRAVLLQMMLLAALSIAALLISVASLLSSQGWQFHSSGNMVEVSATATGPWPILIGIFSFFVCHYYLGKWLARRAAHREWAAFLSFLILDRVLWAAFWTALPIPVVMDAPLLQVFFTGIEVMAVFLGIERGKRLSRRLA